MGSSYKTVTCSGDVSGVTGDETRVIAGSCYVRDTRSGRWEAFSTYVREHHVDLQQRD